MANEYISQVQLPNNETYNIRDKELIPRLKATVGHSNKNLLNLKNIKGKTEYGITWTIDEQEGIVTATGTSQSGKTPQLSFVFKNIPSGNYYFYGCIGGSDATYDVYCWDYTTSSRPKQWDGTTNVYSDYNLVPRQLKIVDNHEIGITLRIKSGVTVNNLIFKPMVWDGDILDDTFEPYQEPTDKLIETKTRSYLTSTVGHACKNLLDITSQTHNSQVVIESIDDKTGSIHISTTGGTNHVGAAWDFSFENGHSYVVSFINLLENAHASVTIRRSDTYTVKYSSGALSTLGNKTFTFTFTDEEFPEGAYVSLRCTDNTGVAGAASISQFMLRESTILDDTFEPYQIPTDERFKDYLPLSGGKLTGRLIMSDSHLTLKGTNIDLDGDNPSSNIWSNSELNFTDVDGTRMSFLNVQEKTDGSTRLELAAQNNNHYNVIDIMIDKDGNRSYSVSSPENFRTALDITACPKSGTANRLAYYSSATQIDSSTGVTYNVKNSTASTPAIRTILGVFGATYGNTAATMISGVKGLFSYGDGGPQINFGTTGAPGGSQDGALIFTDHDSAATGASWHFVSNQTDWNVTSKRFHAKTSMSIGTDLPVTTYALNVTGGALFTDSIIGKNAGGAFHLGRNYASIKKTKAENTSTYYPIFSVKALNSDWTIGTLGNDSGDKLFIVNTLDSNYTGNSNKTRKYSLPCATSATDNKTYPICFGTSLTSGELLIADGTSGAIKTSGETIATLKTYVDNAIDDLPKPMVFKGTLGAEGNNPTITDLPTASEENEGDTYKVITAGTYASIEAKVGDVFTSNGVEWILIPAGDDVEDTWRSIKVNGTEKLGTGISSGGIDFINGTNTTVSFNASGNKISINSTDTNTTYSLSRNNKEIVLTGSDNTTSSVDAARVVYLTNEDLNAVVLPGFYNAGGGNSCTNTPNPSSASGFGLIVLQTGGGAWYYQFFNYCGTTTTYKRVRNGNTGNWTAWAVTDTNTAQATGYANVVKSDDFTWSAGTLPSLTTKSTTIYPVKSTTTTASKIVSKDTTIYPVKSTTTTATKVTTKSTTIYPVTSTTTTASKVVSKDTTIYPVTSSTTTASKVVSKDTTIYPVKSTTTTATKVTTSSTTFDQITGVGTLPTLTVSGITLELNQGTLPTSSSVTINDVVSNTDVTVPILSSSVTLKQISSISDITVPILSSSVTLKQISSISDVTVPILSSSVSITEISSTSDVTVPILSSSVTIKEISSNTDVTVPVLSSSVTISEVSNWSAGTLPSLSWGSVSAVTGVSI